VTLDDETLEQLGYGSAAQYERLAAYLVEQRAKRVLYVKTRFAEDRSFRIARRNYLYNWRAQKPAQWKRIESRYRSSAKGKVMIKEKNASYYERNKKDPVKYAKWLADNKARYHARKAKR
jgi:hypothetical protein